VHHFASELQKLDIYHLEYHFPVPNLMKLSLIKKTASAKNPAVKIDLICFAEIFITT
jgi:hypothetical protein